RGGNGGGERQSDFEAEVDVGRGEDRGDEHTEHEPADGEFFGFHVVRPSGEADRRRPRWPAAAVCRGIGCGGAGGLMFAQVGAVARWRRRERLRRLSRARRWWRWSICTGSC